MMKLLIKNGRVVHPVTGTVVLQDILAENGRIVLMERGLDGEADRVVDAAGLMVAPGLVDMHVHLRDPGLTYKEDILTGCAAAARGGVTSMACMANTPTPLAAFARSSTYFTCSGQSTAGLVLAMQAMEVTPPRAAAAQPVRMSSL